MIVCLFLSELKILHEKKRYFHYFILNIDLIKFVLFIFNKNINPIKSKEFFEFINLNKKKWTISKNIENNSSKNKILIENFINQAECSISNLLIGKYLEKLNKSECIGLLKNGDIKGEVLFRSFKINKFYYYKFGGFFVRLKYLYKAIILLKNVKNINEFYNFKLNGIDIGLTSYDTFMRYTRIPTIRNIHPKLFLFFAEALYANDFFEEIFNNQQISKSVQAERQFVPLNILFQKSLKKKRKVYSRVGTDKIAVLVCTHFNQRYHNRNKFSKKLLNEIYKKYKNKAIQSINKYYKIQMKNKFYGNAWAPYVRNTKKIVALWKKTSDPNFNNKSIKLSSLKTISKNEICKAFNWSKKKKIATVFLPYLIDGNYQHGRKILYLDNCSWTNNTLELIKKNENINWIIRQHPNENRYNSKINFSSIVKNIEAKYKHIRLCPKNIDPISLTKFTDVAVTSHGSVGIEYPSFGIPCIVGENSFYTHCGFTPLKPKNIFEYKNLLKKAHLIKKPKKKEIDKAKIFAFILNILTRTNLSFLPVHIPIFEARMRISDEKEFWHQSIKKLKKFNINTDPFRKMFERQIKLRHRHTVNCNLGFNINKVLNDYSN